MTTLEAYIKAFKKLRLDKSHGVAPHKPILLLSVLQAYQNKLITDNRVYLTPELVALFSTNWAALVTSKHDCRISYPFYYLKSDGFWKLVPKDGFNNLDQLGSLVKSLANLSAAIDYATINHDLYVLVMDAPTNLLLQQCLLTTYFPHTQQLLINTYEAQVAMLETIENKILHENPLAYQQEINTLLSTGNEEAIFIRCGLFKREIPKLYQFTCCISGMLVNPIANIQMVDACHIRPFSESYDDTIGNGITLCPNLHRAFDKGLIGVDANYSVLVSKHFVEADSAYALKSLAGKPINLPANFNYHPLRENFKWHREQWQLN